MRERLNSIMQSFSSSSFDYLHINVARQLMPSFVHASCYFGGGSL